MSTRTLQHTPHLGRIGAGGIGAPVAIGEGRQQREWRWMSAGAGEGVRVG